MSPILFSVDGIQIRYFSVLYALGVVLIYIQLKGNLNRSKIRMTRDELLNLLIIVFIYGVIGARCYYVFFNLDYYFSSNENWYEFLAIWNGGLALNGGIIFSTLVLWVLCSGRKTDFGAFIDQLVAPLLLAMAVISIGRFINTGSLDLLLNDTKTLVFNNSPTKIQDFNQNYRPVELYETLMYFFGYTVMKLIGGNRFRAGFTASCGLFYYSLTRIVFSLIAHDELTILGIEESLLAGITGGILAMIFLFAGRLYRKPPQRKEQFPSTRKWKV